MPIPPGPVSVISRTSGSASSAAAASRSESRPISGPAGAGRGGTATGRGRRRLGQQQVERRILREHRALELLQLATGLEPEVLHQRPPGVAERVERLGLAAGSVEREHQLRVEPLAVRVLGDQRLQLAGHGDVLTQLELDLDALLDGGQLQLGEPAGLGRGEAPQRDVRERRAAEEGERLPPEPRGRLRIAVAAGRARPLAERLEAREVELVRLEANRVAGRERHDRLLGAERAAQLGEMDLQGLGGGRRRIVSPQLVDEPRGGHRVLPVRQQQDGQQRALLGRLELDRALRPGHAERSKEREVQRFTHA